jgi:hypothetical protein
MVQRSVLAQAILESQIIHRDKDNMLLHFHLPQPSEALQVEINEQIGPIAGAATYRSAEYSLVYKAAASTAEVNAMHSASDAWRQSGRRIFVTADFVTLTFDGAPFAFTEFDAYANDARWAERDIALPISAGRGRVTRTWRSAPDSLQESVRGGSPR